MMKEKIRKKLIKLGFNSKPDFIIVGTQKGGTSGLYDILKNHPKIKPSLTKEIHYFDNDDWYNKNKIEDYHSFFPLSFEQNKSYKTFEATPMYLYHPNVAKRLYNYNKDLKLIILLRDPVERAFSAWTMYHHHFTEGKHSRFHDPRTFDIAIKEEIEDLKNETYHSNKRAYVNRGIYYKQIERYYKLFDRNQILIIQSKKLKQLPSLTLNIIQNFIEVPEQKLKYVTSNSSSINEKERYADEFEMLSKFYKPHNKKLFELIGKNFDWN
ncbi:MAG: sulfotransferase domain-containing protein [Flavobacteriaceae bacterium]|nr:sulfotransferase domain-containing protein [Flavobacteriaceae bacterium]